MAPAQPPGEQGRRGRAGGRPGATARGAPHEQRRQRDGGPARWEPASGCSAAHRQQHWGQSVLAWELQPPRPNASGCWPGQRATKGGRPKELPSAAPPQWAVGLEPLEQGQGGQSGNAPGAARSASSSTSSSAQAGAERPPVQGGSGLAPRPGPAPPGDLAGPASAARRKPRARLGAARIQAEWSSRTLGVAGSAVRWARSPAAWDRGRTATGQPRRLPRRIA